MCVRVYMCMRACMYMCVCVFVCVCVCEMYQILYLYIHMLSKRNVKG